MTPAPAHARLQVVKVGGSLFDLPDLAARLRDLKESLSPAPVVFFPGGGPLVEALRVLDRTHQLGEETSHWLALRALDVNAHLLHALLPECPVVAWSDVFTVVSSRRASILEPHSFARADDAHLLRLPHTWEVTSDSLAVRAACLLGGGCLLLKSVVWHADDWEEAARHGIVDAYFPQALHQSPGVKVAVRCLRKN